MSIIQYQNIHDKILTRIIRRKLRKFSVYECDELNRVIIRGMNNMTACSNQPECDFDKCPDGKICSLCVEMVWAINRIREEKEKHGFTSNGNDM